MEDRIKTRTFKEQGCQRPGKPRKDREFEKFGNVRKKKRNFGRTQGISLRMLMNNPWWK